VAISIQASRAREAMKAGGKRCPRNSPGGGGIAESVCSHHTSTAAVQWTAAAADKVVDARGSQGYHRARGLGGHGQPAEAPPTHA
jgi:hypothetical protein